MDLKFCGIIDIIMVLGGIIMLFVGYKKGFITKILSVASILLIIIFSFFFASTLTGYLKDWNLIYPNILSGITNNINANLENVDVPADATTVQAVSILLHIPEWIAQPIVNFMGDGVPSELAQLVNAVADTVTRWCCNVISFFIIAFGVILIIAIAKLIAAIFRQNKVFRFIDGVFGVLLYEVIYIAILSVLFLILYFLYNNANIEGLNNFVKVDMQMDTEAFRISKWFYENNIIKTLISIIFHV